MRYPGFRPAAWYPYVSPYQAAPMVVFGQAIPTNGDPQPPSPGPAPSDRGVLESTGDALKQITPSLIVLGVAAGAAFALGSGLVHRYLFKSR